MLDWSGRSMKPLIESTWRTNINNFVTDPRTFDAIIVSATALLGSGIGTKRGTHHKTRHDPTIEAISLFQPPAARDSSEVEANVEDHQSDDYGAEDDNAANASAVQSSDVNVGDAYTAEDEDLEDDHRAGLGNNSSENEHGGDSENQMDYGDGHNDGEEYYDEDYDDGMYDKDEAYNGEFEGDAGDGEFEGDAGEGDSIWMY